MYKEFLLKNKYILLILAVVVLVVISFQMNKTKNSVALKNTPAQLSISGVNETALKAMEAIPQDNVPTATEKQGLQELSFKVENGEKVFNLTAAPVKWDILKDVTVTAWAYNGMVPGPLIRVTDGDKVKILVKNNLSEPTTIHWHGIQVPNNMDGIPDETQKPIQPGETFIYEFVAKPSGTYWYHSHFDSDKQISVGLSGAFIIDPVGGLASKPNIDKIFMLNEWRVIDGQTYAAMPATGMDANFFTINGKAYPDTQPVNAKVGQKKRRRFIAPGKMTPPRHFTGFSLKIVATDGNDVPLSAQWTKDLVNGCYIVIFRTTQQTTIKNRADL